MEILTFVISAIFIQNVVLTKFLGLCPFFGVSKNSKGAIGMGLAVTFVIFGSSLITYFLYYGVLVPNGLEYLQLISFILVIAAFVQFLEMMLKKHFPQLYKTLGIYLPLITTNCVVLYVAQENIAQKYDLLKTIVHSLAVPIGYMVVLVLFSSIRERLESSDIPKFWKGNPIALIAAGLMALAFSGLEGIV